MLGQFLGIDVIGNRTHRRQADESLTQTLHPPALLIHGQQQIRTHGSYAGRQLAHLTWAFDVARKQNQTGDLGLTQDLPILRGQPGARDIQHQ